MFVVFFGVGMVLASLQYGTITHNQAQAAATDNLVGWIYANPIGWTSVNDTNTGSGGGTYGLNIDTNRTSPTYLQINGFAWNDDAGMICFGSSCKSTSACSHTPPPSDPKLLTTCHSSDPLVACIDSVGTNNCGTDPLLKCPTTVRAHGWANVCNEGDKGWISLNADDIVGGSPAFSYFVQYIPYKSKFGLPVPSTPPGGLDLQSYAWNGNSDGTGFGYMDFSNMSIRPETKCTDGIDNDLNGYTDCKDAACGADPACNVCTKFPDGSVDCTNPACALDPVCNQCKNSSGTLDCSLSVTVPSAGTCCSLVSGCKTDPKCTIATGEAAACGVGAADKCCSDKIDNDGKNGTDCADPSCLAGASVCLPAYLQANYGNVYAQNGIKSEGVVSHASFCLSSTSGGITGFSSGSGFSSGLPCAETTSTSQGTISSSGYTGPLGSLDITGILAGRYGKVIQVATNPVSPVWIPPAILGGNVYYVKGNVTLNGAAFANGTGASSLGNGLLFVDGGDLTIANDVKYVSQQLPTSLRSLASLGVIVRQTKKPDGTLVGGNLNILPNVATVSGAYFVEGTVKTGTATPGVPVDASPLQIYGLMAAHQFNLQRQFHSATQAAETFIFDGRAIANPPPGMSEVGKSLPTTQTPTF